MKKEGLLVSVYRYPGGDATNGGISSKVRSAVLLGADGPFEPDAESPALYLAVWYDRLIACPVDLEAEYPKERDARGPHMIRGLGGHMFGGNFIYTSDSRFSDLFRSRGFSGPYPIPVYDRREWPMTSANERPSP